MGNFKGYNEIVVGSETWLENLPHSVDAFFIIDCNDEDENLHYGGTSANCGEAHERTRSAHRAFLHEYKLDAARFPLLKLRPTNWKAPFASADGQSDGVSLQVALSSDAGPALITSAAALSRSSSSPPPVKAPAVRCATCAAHKANGNGLSSAKCDAMIRDPYGKLWSMWASGGWSRRSSSQPACFEEGWQRFDFDDVLRGEGCDRNWLEGFHDRPQFPKPAPALLGFDETIYAYCSAEIGEDEGPFYQDNGGLARRCVEANENVLRVTSGWNMCMNLHWQLCAVQGRLHGQSNGRMHFSIAPKDLDIGIFESPESCIGGCDGGYAISDVYFAEVCVLSHICKNRAELFRAEVGTIFECDFDRASFLELRTLLGGSG